MGISTEQEQMLLELLYGEVDAERATLLKSQIDSDPILTARFQSWQSVRTLMADLPEHEPDLQIHYDLVRAARHAVADAKAPSGLFAWLQSIAMAPAAASIGLLVLAGSTLLWMSGRVSEDAAVSQPKSPIAEAPRVEVQPVPELAAEVKEEVAVKTPPQDALGKASEFGREVKEKEDNSPTKEGKALPGQQPKQAIAAKDRAGFAGLNAKGERSEQSKADKAQLGLDDSLLARDTKAGQAKAEPTKSRAKRSARVKSKRPQKKSKPKAAPKRSKRAVAEVSTEAVAETEVTANKGRGFAPPPPAKKPFAPPPSAAEPEPVVAQAEDDLVGSFGDSAEAVDEVAKATTGRAATQVPMSLSQARAAKKRGDLRAAVGFYQSFFNGNRNHPEFPRALFEAAESYERLGETPRAIKLYKLLARGRSRYAERAEMRLNTLKGIQAAQPVAADKFDDVEAKEPANEPVQTAPSKD